MWCICRSAISFIETVSCESWYNLYFFFLLNSHIQNLAHPFSLSSVAVYVRVSPHTPLNMSMHTYSLTHNHILSLSLLHAQTCTHNLPVPHLQGNTGVSLWQQAACSTNEPVALVTAVCRWRQWRKLLLLLLLCTLPCRIHKYMQICLWCKQD